MQVHKYDVVIVGAGGAGMRAAIGEGRFFAFAERTEENWKRGDIPAP